MNSNAAASQSSGRRGMLVSLLIGLLLLILLMLTRSEQTECMQAPVKMGRANSWQNLGAGKTKAIRPPRAFSFNHPKRKLG